jgi:formylglycine-generating enzyme required for sulfatase activity
MKRILGLAVVLDLLAALSVNAQQIKTDEVDVIDLGKGIKLEMVLIPAGKFTMGSFALEEGRDKYENEREITITKPFYMGKYEVTQEQWEAVMGNNPCREKKTKLPVTKVSWNDSQEFIKKLNAKTNEKYRLPTEAEWEYACRAGTRTRYSFGDKITKTDCNWFFTFNEKPIEVGSYKPNPWGLYDMHGNVWEYCEDWYLDIPYSKDDTIDPKGLEIGKGRVQRGGAFYNKMHHLRSASRAYTFPDIISQPTNMTFGYETAGFRLARTK